MNTRYSLQPDPLCNSSTAIPFSSNPPGEEHRIVLGTRNRFPRAPSSSILLRTAMRISRARWFNFLRRVFHYQNGSRSDLGSNPFNSSTWMMLQFLALVIQISIISFTLAISKEERPIWPMRIWIVGYDIGCLLSLLLLYRSYHRLHLSQADRFGLSDIEQQRTNEESRKCLGVRFSISILPSSSESPRTLYLIVRLECSELLFPIPVVPTPMLLCTTYQQPRYNMNMGSIDRGASDDQISRLPSWRYKEFNSSLELDHDSDCNTSRANEDLVNLAGQ
ncbi:serine-rich family protein [Hibiscus syriacus]|uniref:Serine-rich family protein n=1 Tax=Hibiscus syriacus TaxID=106335 RepID=A0A6A2ZQ50_HIBSY|nr:serine-rich family protein [Hibiscus syriacus]